MLWAGKKKKKKSYDAIQIKELVLGRTDIFFYHLFKGLSLLSQLPGCLEKVLHCDSLFIIVSPLSLCFNSHVNKRSRKVRKLSCDFVFSCSPLPQVLLKTAMSKCTVLVGQKNYCLFISFYLFLFTFNNLVLFICLFINLVFSHSS